MISFLQWNINGYFNNYVNLELLIKTLNPSVVLLNETHLASGVSAHTPKAYIGYFYNLPHNAISKQGIAILVKRNLPHIPIPLPLSIIASLAIEIQTPNKISIACAYCPPNQFFTTTDFTNLFPPGPHPFILAGDFNAWSPLWGSVSANARGHAIEDAILISNSVILNDGSPTHFSTHNTLTHIDLTLCSASLSPKVSWRLLDDLHCSDHFPIVFTIPSRPLNFFKPRVYFKTDLADWAKFEDACETFSCYFPVSSNINQETSCIQKIIRSAANKAIPLTPTRPIRPSPLWWSSELSKLRESKQHAWRQFKRNHTSTNLIMYKKANALFRRSAKAAKVACFKKFTSTITASSSTKKVWADIRKLTGLPSHSPLSFLKSPNGNLLYPRDIALELASHFSNSSSDSNFPPEFTASKLAILRTPRPSPNGLTSSARQLDADLTLLELRSALSAVKGRTPGFDKISYPIINHLPMPFISRLLRHYNNIFKTGHYPHLWKTSSVIPILKVGKPSSEVNSYRPISLLPCLGKLLEKIIATRLSWFVNSNKFIHHNQVAFKKGQGTLDALLHLDHVISDVLSCRNHISLLSLDFLKAFDRIGIHVVLRQLDKWKVGPRIYNFIKSFLSNRKVSVLISNIRSPILSLDNGTPQGSPLSVILFKIAFDELSVIFSDFPTVSHQIYADDVLLFSKSSDLHTVMSTFSNILSRISHWSLSSGASISSSKSKLLHICKKRSCSIPLLNFNGVNIICEDSLKFLGLVLDSKYSFKEHCKYVRQKLYVKLNILKYLSCKRSFIGSDLLINVTKALISSIVNYGLEIYGLHAKNHLKMLAAPYHTAVRRSIRAFPTSPIKNILAEAGLPCLFDNMEDSIRKLYPKLMLTSNIFLRKDFHSATSRTRTPKISSAIYMCSIYAKENCLPAKLSLPRYNLRPPWLLNKSSLINDLSYFQKSNTTSAEYNACFLDISTRSKATGWQLLFTDGSKADYTSFAVVKENGENISYGLLFPFCSIFTAEATAILHAVQYATKAYGKFIICSDSLSCFQAVKNLNNHNYIIGCIRNIMIIHPLKIRLMWVPGHTGISGNIFADKAAKDMSFTPVTTSSLFCKNDIHRFIVQQRQDKILSEWVNYMHHYARINPSHTKPCYPSSIPSNYITPYTRLRIGHSIITNAHLLQGTQPNLCPFCDAPVSVLHLLVFCPELEVHRRRNFNHTDPLQLLMNPSHGNVSKIYKFLKDSDLLRRI
ncbi:PREDICTED: RNA-directed DNA polymerase from mobile element jockey-like [Rhagoletis zephyria]|uniref:RNA-directed DNA polymerase from mobile element jockey-like n=1 Tax=Rhagoletis zephyria TaxID=28612 RepID=UPI000811328B|nr:PREDICTED: RNA-directed DNA polymerase from mobile element jockey-like [Rhagoletis zephyria]